ncbi:MAG: hypothetical protein WCE62_09095, partial [Polyangiales bacterium]
MKLTHDNGNRGRSDLGTCAMIGAGTVSEGFHAFTILDFAGESDDGSRGTSNPVTQDMMVKLRLPLERALRSGHPWIYRRALCEAPKVAGEVVAVQGRDARLVGRGISDDGAIAVRMFTTGDEPVDARLFAARLAEAVALRERVLPSETDAYRLVHGEGDRLPGFVVDIYAAYAVLRFDSPALHSWLPLWLQALTPYLQ